MINLLEIEKKKSSVYFNPFKWNYLWQLKMEIIVRLNTWNMTKNSERRLLLHEVTSQKDFGYFF